MFGSESYGLRLVGIFRDLPVIRRPRLIVTRSGIIRFEIILRRAFKQRYTAFAGTRHG